MKNATRRIRSLARLWAPALFLLLFAAGAACGRVASWAGLDPEPATIRGLGWAAALALIFPYLHVAGRRSLRHRRAILRLPLLSQAWWLRAHLASAWLAFLLTLVHSRGRAGTWLTACVLGLSWAVMLSGALWYWGGRLIYRVLVFTAAPEYGRARLTTKERLRLMRRSRRLIDEYWKFTEYDVSGWPAFCRDLLDETSLLHRAVWAKLEKSGLIIYDAVRAARHATDPTAGRLGPGEMNPVIGALNQLISREQCDLFPEFAREPTEKEVQAANTDAKKEELRRRAENVREVRRLREGDARVGRLLDEAATLEGKDRQGLRNRRVLEALCPLVRECEEPSEVLRDFWAGSVRRFLEAERAGWGWLFTAEAREPVPANEARRVRAVVSPRQGLIVDQLLLWVERRRLLNVEAWLDRLATVWLTVHGAVSAVLLVLVADHVLGSIRYGGF
jgi:hypothetical protein